MKDLIVVLILVLILGGATTYIVRAKKRGAKCIGCPSGCNCCPSKTKEDNCDCGCCSPYFEDK